MSIDLNEQTLPVYMDELGRSGIAAAKALRLASAIDRANAIKAMAVHIRNDAGLILAANAQDMTGGKAKGLSGAMLDRLLLTPARIEAIAAGLESVSALPDPIGAVDEFWTRPNGLVISKVRTPIGVIGMIYESRPNVTADAASLCIKSGNACILRGGSEAQASNTAIYNAIIKGLADTGLPETCVQYVGTTSRDAVGLMLSGLNGAVDLIIPRGGKGLVSRVQRDARIPVLAHLEGRNHTYVHKGADPQMAAAVLLNAKMRRTGVCGSTETLIIDKAMLPHLGAITEGLIDAGCSLKGDAAARDVVPMDPATEQDYETEYLDAILNVKTVSNIDEALAHIDRYGSGHTDCIITANDAAATRFLTEVDSAIVMHNASTQYADGGEFGFGAEIGIATGRLHARGPVGAQHLTSFKYQVAGTGQVRP